MDVIIENMGGNAETLCTFEPQAWLEMITSHDAKSACSKGFKTSYNVIISSISLGTISNFSGLRKRVVSKRVVLADVPLYLQFLQKVFPCSAILTEESYDF